MNYKLYYTNEYGKIVYPTGDLPGHVDVNREYNEEYENLDDAKAKGDKFLHKFPLMNCVIYTSDGDKITLSASKDEFDKAWQVRKQAQEHKWKKKKKSDLMNKLAFYLIVGVVFIYYFYD